MGLGSRGGFDTNQPKYKRYSTLDLHPPVFRNLIQVVAVPVVRVSKGTTERNSRLQYTRRRKEFCP